VVKTERAEWPTVERPEPPPSRKFTFGPGPLGLGLADAEGGGVKVTEVVSGSTAAQLGVDVGVVVLALNGSDVTGHGKVSLSKMIGYLPRPLVLTLSVLMDDPVEPAAQVEAGAAGQPAVAAKEKTKPALKKKLKSSRNVKRTNFSGQKGDPRHGPSALLNQGSDDGPQVLATEADADAEATESAVDDQAAGDAASGERPRRPLFEPSDNAASPRSSPEGARGSPSEGTRLRRPSMQESTLETCANEDGAEEDEDELGEDDANADVGSSAADAHETVDDEALPTGAAPAPSLVTSVTPTEPTVPHRAHPPPAAPIEAFPPWATAPPMRSPRHVVGTGAKYVLKSTQEAFNHPSLMAHQAFAKAESPASLQQQQQAASTELIPTLEEASAS